MTANEAGVFGSPDNPRENTLPQGIAPDQVQSAVLKSGYPLQSVVAAELKKCFPAVQEEWTYIDRARKDQRTLDVFCYQSLGSEREIGVSPSLILLVECKRSELPYIFFKTAVGARARDFPRVLGLRTGFTIKDNNSKAFRQSYPAEALGLHEESFVGTGPPICTGLSHAARKGRNLALSGAQPFRRIVLPLVSALEHATNYYAPVSRDAKRYWADLTLCIAVIDAPMLVAEANPDAPGLYLHPWARVIHHEVSLEDKFAKRETYYAIDFVHRAYLATFIRDHVEPLAKTFAARVEERQQVLLAGGGIVKDLNAWSWTELQPYVRK